MIDTKKILYIKLTDRCNLKCSHCYAGCTIYGQDMSPEVVDKILELYPKEPTEIIFHGGEPILCLKTLERLVDHFLPNSNCRLNITTNLCYKISNEILDILKRIHYVSTSWDTKVRFKEEGQQELWMKNCEFLVDNGIDLQINTVLTKDLVAKQELRPALLFLDTVRDFSGVDFVISEKSEPVICLLEGVYGLYVLIPISFTPFKCLIYCHAYLHIIRCALRPDLKGLRRFRCQHFQLSV